VIILYQGQPVEAEWSHARVTAVYEYIDNDSPAPYGGPCWNLNLDRGPNVTSFITFAKWEIKHTPEVGEVYSELLAVVVNRYPVLVATLGEEVLYDHRDKEEARP
jgi:hypothetical protein